MNISPNFANLTSCEKMTIFRNYAVTSGLCYIMTFPPHKKKPVHDPGVSMRPTLTYWLHKTHKNMGYFSAFDIESVLYFD